MKTSPVRPEDLRARFAAIAVMRDEAGKLDLRATKWAVETAAQMGATCFVVGADSSTRVESSDELRALCGFLAQFPKDWWAIPVVGDVPRLWSVQAEVLRSTFFPCVGVGLGAVLRRDPDRPDLALRELSREAKKPLAIVVDLARELVDRPSDKTRRLLQEAVCAFAIQTETAGDEVMAAGTQSEETLKRLRSILDDGRIVVVVRSRERVARSPCVREYRC